MPGSGSGFWFFAAGVIFSIQGLAVEIYQGNRIPVNKPNTPHSCPAESFRDECTQSAKTHDNCPRAQKFFLAFRPEFRKGCLPHVPV
jgi:hypothetical protein